VNFEIRHADSFSKHFVELPFTVQEAVLDMLESMREHPGDFIDRDFMLPTAAVCTGAARVEMDAQYMWFMIVFQYDADEQSIHAIDVVVVTEEK
jgi:hypothetical protein